VKRKLASILDDLVEVAARVDEKQMCALGNALRGARKIFVAGTGRSGLMARAFAMRLMHLGLKPHVVGETTTPDIQSGDLLVCCTRRGESGSHSHFIDLAHGAGARVAVLTASVTSSNALKADLAVTLSLEESTEGHQPLGALFEQSLLLVLEAMIMKLMDDLEVDEEVMKRHHTSLE
jgi:6-phospho-3-hexuloisomerase